MPAPSVPATSTASLMGGTRMSPPKPPMPSSTSGWWIDLQPLLEQPDGFVAGGDVDARILVGEVLVGGHDPPSFCVFSPVPVGYSSRHDAPRAGHPYRRRGLVCRALERQTPDDRHNHPAAGGAGRGRPGGLPALHVEVAVRGKLPWVRRKLGERVALPQLAPRRPLAAGESFPYLGCRYPLVLTRTTAPTAGPRGGVMERRHDARRRRVDAVRPSPCGCADASS